MKTLILIASVIFSQLTFADGEFNKPKTVTDLRSTSVRILNQEMTSGGTGVIFRSFENASHILTNKHVCRLIEQGGVVDYNGTKYEVTHYKKFEQHDLCLVRVESDLKINLQISETLAPVTSKTIVSGHPLLLPHIVNVGHLTDRKDIQLIVGLVPCTKEDAKKDLETALICAFLGGKPLVKTFDSQVTSNMIQPGNSGSGVFNAEGELVGIVFAGQSREFSYAFIVPQIYLLYFTQNAHRFEWIKVGTPVDDQGIRGRVFDYEKCAEAKTLGDKYKSVKALCKGIGDSLIWSK